MSGHIPGPWRLIWHGNESYPFPLSIETEDGSYWIARDGTCSSKANADLIAAAPDLLAALENLTIAIGMGWDLDGVLERARAAIAKAEGTK